VDGGTQQIAQGIAATLGEKVSLEQPVHSVCFDGDWYNVATAHSRFLAKAIVVAIPPHLTNRILFEPALGALRQQYCQRCPMGSTIKAHVRFPTPFWRDKGLSGEVVSDGKPLSVIYDDTDYAGTQPGLVAFMVADAAREAADLSPEERQAWVIRSLRRLLGNDVDAYLEYSDHIWATDPYTGGAPVAFHAPGALSSCGMALRKPIHNLFWAGTETAREWTGFMEGAVESGHRAAWEVLETL
jgi:monoamine oxidase